MLMTWPMTRSHELCDAKWLSRPIIFNIISTVTCACCERDPSTLLHNSPLGSLQLQPLQHITWFAVTGCSCSLSNDSPCQRYKCSPLSARALTVIILLPTVFSILTNTNTGRIQHYFPSHQPLCISAFSPSTSYPSSVKNCASPSWIFSYQSLSLYPSG